MTGQVKSFSLFVLFAAAMVSPVSALTTAPATSMPSRLDEIRRAEEKLKSPRPSLWHHHSPALDAALKKPELLWDLLISPETTHIDRQAAALQAADHLPSEYFIRSFQAQAELRREWRLHHWGLKQHPLDNRAGVDSWENPPPKSWLKTERNVLGAKWKLNGEQDMPLTFEEESRAPWPWQVQQALSRIKWPAEMRLTECIKIAIRTDEEAWLFFEQICFNALPDGDSALPLLARCRRLATDRSFPVAAAWIAERAPSMAECSNRGKGMGEILARDILRHSPHPQARRNAAYHLASLPCSPFMRDYLGTKEASSLVWAVAYIAMCERDSMSDGALVNGFIYPICVSCSDPPEIPGILTRDIRPGTPEARDAIIRFEKWYFSHRNALMKKDMAREKELKPLRESLDRFPSD